MYSRIYSRLDSIISIDFVSLKNIKALKYSSTTYTDDQEHNL